MGTEERLVFLVGTILAMVCSAAVVLALVWGSQGDPRQRSPVGKLLRDLLSQLSGWYRLGVVCTLAWWVWVGAVFVLTKLDREEFLEVFVLLPAGVWLAFVLCMKLFRWLFLGFFSESEGAKVSGAALGALRQAATSANFLLTTAVVLNVIVIIISLVWLAEDLPRRRFIPYWLFLSAPILSILALLRAKMAEKPDNVISLYLKRKAMEEKARIDALQNRKEK